MEEKGYKFMYGVPNRFKDVTNYMATKCLSNDKLTLPLTDSDRAAIFGDHLVGVLKCVKLFKNRIPIRIIESGEQYDQLNIEHLPIDKFLDFEEWVEPFTPSKVREWCAENYAKLHPKNLLDGLHVRLDFRHGNQRDEYPEQLMTVTYLKPDDVVLEIGSNIGRNTCIIASVLKDDRNLVTLETMKDSSR